MRLLLDVSAVPARPVGAGVYTVELARELAAHDVTDLHLVTRQADTRRWSDLAPKATLHPEVPERRPRRLAVGADRGAASSRAGVGADLWHGPHYTLPLRLDVPAVVTVHDLTFFEHPEWHERSEGRVLPPHDPVEHAPRPRAVIARQRHTARPPHAPCWHPPRPWSSRPTASTTPGSATPAATPTTSRSLAALGIRPPYLAFAGTLEPRKDVPDARSPRSRGSRRARPDLRLVIAGPGRLGRRPRSATRRRAAASPPASPGSGWIDDDVLPAFFRQAEAVAYPSLEEGFGLPALEALACGAALVTTTGSAMEEVVGDAARARRRPPIPPALAHGARPRARPTRRSRPGCAAAGPAPGRDFTWAASVDQHLAAYARCACGETA